MSKLGNVYIQLKHLLILQSGLLVFTAIIILGLLLVLRHVLDNFECIFLNRQLKILLRLTWINLRDLE